MSLVSLNTSLLKRGLPYFNFFARGCTVTRAFIPIRLLSTHDTNLAVIPHNKRHEKEFCVPNQGQTISLSPAEDALARVSRLLSGSMRLSVCIVLESGGRLSVDDVKEAVKILQKTQVMLRCKVTIQEPQSQHSTLPLGSKSHLEEKFQLVVDDNVKIPTNEYEVDAATCGPMEDVCNKVWSSQIEKNPLAIGQSIARVDIITDKVSKTVGGLLLSCEHAFCDGQSLGHLSHTLMQILENMKRNVNNNNHQQQQPHQRVLTIPGSGEKWQASFEAASIPFDIEAASDRLKHWETCLQKFPQPDSREVAQFTWARASFNAWKMAETCTTRVLRFELTSLDCDRLRMKCRQAKTTITGALGASIMQSCADLISKAKEESDYNEHYNNNNMEDGHGSNREIREEVRSFLISLACGASTRHLYPSPIPPHVLSYHMSRLPHFFMPMERGASKIDVNALWGIAKKYRDHIDSAISANFPLAISDMIGKAWTEEFLDKQIGSSKKPFTTSLINWGVSSLQDKYGDDLIVKTCYPLANMSHVAYPIFIVSSASSKLTVTLLTNKECVDSTSSHALLNRTKGLLYSIINS